MPDVGGPDINLNLSDVLDGTGIGDADGGGIGGLLALSGDSDGLNFLGLNGDTNSLVNVDGPVGAEGSVGAGGDGFVVNLDADESPLDLGGDGGLLNLGGDGDGFSPLTIDDDTNGLINADLHDGQSIGAADVGDLIHAALLDDGGTGGMGSILHLDAQHDAYDGNIPLAGDLSSALGATLDHLTTSSSLFDVPALDILSVDGLDS